MTNAVAQLAIRLLGTPEIQIAGEPLLTLHNYKARALLFYLAATGQSHTRDHLATLLWSEAPDSNARHSLRSSLYHLRQALQAKGVGDVLVGDGDLVYLRSDDDGCDVSRFHRLIATESESALAEAVSLYHGPLLQGFTLPDAPVFEEWVRFEGARLNHAYLGALQRLASRSESRQSWEEAIGYVQRIVQVDPLAEETQQRLISLYLRIGAIGLALRQYRQFETELSHELGLTPSLDTQALLDEALRTQRSTPSLTKTSPHLSENFPETLPFIGRDNALNKLLAISQDTITTGHGTAVLLQGENGVGKSRLVDGLVASLLVEAHPWIILKGSCSPFDDLLPYGPFLEAFQSAALGDLTDLLTRSHEVGPGEQGEFAWRVLQALRMLSHSAPLLIAIDDLQWANSSTLQLFGFLATKLRSMPVMLLGTMQDVESIPALQRLITVGRRHGDVHVLSLEPLTQGAVTDLLQASALSSSSIVTLTEWLYERSGGNPFILMEILTQLRTEAILIPAGAGWRLETGRWLRWRSTHALPETIHDLVDWRLANLSSDARYLLEVFAVADQPLPLALLSDFPGVQSEHLVSILDDLLARRLVIEAANERLALSHSLIRETLVYRLSHFRRRTIHRQLVEILEACPALRKDFPLRQIALHAVAAQDLERARRYGLQFLVELSQDYASAEVVDFLHQLYDLLTPTASLDEMLRLTHTLGNFHQSLGHLEVATGWYLRNLELARKAANPGAIAAAYFEMGELALVTNDYTAAASAAESGLAACRVSEESQRTAIQGRGHRLLGAALAMEGSNLPAAESHLQESIAAHRLTGNLNDLCATLFELGNVAAQRGELSRALEFYDEARNTASASHVYYFHALACNNFAYHSLLLGRLEAAQQSIKQAHKLAETYELPGALLHIYSTQGEIQLYLGEWQAAAESFHHGLALADELGNLERQAGYRAGLALAARGQNDFETATALLEEALALIHERGYWHLRARIQLWLAETLLHYGRIDEAGPHLDAALTVTRAHGRMLLRIQGERLYARFLAVQGDWSAAKTLFTEIVERLSEFGLPLEIARTQVAWGESALLYAPDPGAAKALIASARKAFAAHNAHGELL